MKKIFIISSVFFVLILILYGVYRFGFQNSTDNPVADEQEKAQSKEQETNKPILSPRLTVVLSEPIIGATLRNGKIAYYSKRDHALKEADLDGKNPQIIFENLPSSINRLVWSPREDALLYATDTGGTIRWYSLFLKDPTPTALRDEMSRLVWTSLGDGILYQYTDPITRKGSLNFARPNGQNWKKIVDFDTRSHFITPVPQSGMISFWARPNGLEQNQLETVGLSGEGRKVLVANHFGTDFLWSKNGDHILVGSVTEKGKNEPLIGITNSQGGEYRDLLLPTLISKIVWAKDNATIFYALPGAFPQEATLPNDYFNRTYQSRDTFWKMNVITGKRERLVPLEEMSLSLDATNLFLSQDETTLFFEDRTSEKLYRLEL